MTQTWQPIEIAPKDGTQILAYWPAPNYAPDAPCIVNTWWVHCMHSKWITPYEEQGVNVCPTHWMPLPLPPTEETT
jgi:hypothetical protein